MITEKAERYANRVVSELQGIQNEIDEGKMKEKYTKN